MAAAPPDAKEAPLAVLHCFRPRAPGGSEVCLSATQAFFEASLALCGARGAAVVEAGFPEVAALGPLPAGYVDGRPAGSAVLLHLLRHYGPLAGAAAAGETWARAMHLEGVLSRTVEVALWLHGPCYRGHTYPSVRRGLRSALPLPASWFCWQRRRAAVRASGGARRGDSFHCDKSRGLRDFASVLGMLQERLEEQRGRIRQGAMPGLDDLVIYSHARVLLDVPPGLAPWRPDLPGLEGLRLFADSFREALLDTDGPWTRAFAGRSWLGQAPPGKLGRLLDELALNELELGDAAGEGAEGLEGKGSRPAKRNLARAPAAEEAGQRPWSGLPTSGCSGTSADARTAGTPTTPGEDKEGADKASAMPVAHWRHNLLFAAWWTLSMSAFAAWSWRQKSRRPPG